MAALPANVADLLRETRRVTAAAEELARSSQASEAADTTQFYLTTVAVAGPYVLALWQSTPMQRRMILEHIEDVGAVAASAELLYALSAVIQLVALGHLVLALSSLPSMLSVPVNRKKQGLMAVNNAVLGAVIMLLANILPSAGKLLEAAGPQASLYVLMLLLASSLLVVVMILVYEYYHRGHSVATQTETATVTAAEAAATAAAGRAGQATVVTANSAFS